MDERELFEAWHREYVTCCEDCRDNCPHEAWERTAWEQGRAPLLVELAALRQRIDKWEGLLRESRDNAYASVVEQGISDDRRKYRIGLVQRIERALD